jgi:ACT domain-containing protein
MSHDMMDESLNKINGSRAMFYFREDELIEILRAISLCLYTISFKIHSFRGLFSDYLKNIKTILLMLAT